MNMKILRNTALAAVLIFLVCYAARSVIENNKISKHIRVLVVSSGASMAHKPEALAYKSVLEEEGIPFQFVSVSYLLSANPAELEANCPAIIFPDNICSSLPPDIKPWVSSYLAAGGSCLFVYDAGVRTPGGFYRDESLFTEFCGVNYVLYSTLKERSYVKGSIQFKDNVAAGYFGIPPGKLFGGKLLTGYVYGSLQYPIARTETAGGFSADDVYAYAVIGENDRLPAVILRNYGKGKVVYVNLPLGFLKAYSDDLPLRSVLRTFAFKVVHLPHLLNVPRGKGGLVINWHIDANIDYKSIPFMIEKKYLRKGLEYSLHITAGDFRDKPGDGLGFDAEGKGRKYAEMLLGYGIIGSHGGWAHNWFADNIERGLFKKPEVEMYIKKNNDALKAITGYNITEYAAPVGVHVQPYTTEALQELGMGSYYYTGDSGSSPNRTFSNGVMISTCVIAFPLMPLGISASFYEMEQAGRTPREVKDWLLSTVDYITSNRTVRLIYSHPYNISSYPGPISDFLDYAQARMRAGDLTVKPMSYFAEFMMRFLRTEYYFSRVNGGLEVNIDNPEGLKDITVAVPRNGYIQPEGADISVSSDEDYYYMVVNDNPGAKKIFLKESK